MSFVVWNPLFEFGIPEMDQQHKKWVEILNQFYDNLEGENISGKVQTMLQEVLEYTQYHFAEEEKLMRSIGYPDIEEQKAMHREMTQKIVDFKSKIDAGENVLTLAFTAELRNWFKEHILVEDRKYAALYLSKTKGPS